MKNPNSPDPSGSYLMRIRLNGERNSGFSNFTYVSYTGELTGLMRLKFNAIYDLVTKDYVKFNGSISEREKVLKLLHERCKHVDKDWMIRQGLAKKEPDLIERLQAEQLKNLSPLEFEAGTGIGVSSSMRELVADEEPRMFSHWLEN